MVGKFEGEKSTKLITLSILRLPAKIQKYQIGPAGKNPQGFWQKKTLEDFDHEKLKDFAKNLIIRQLWSLTDR